MGAGTWGVDVEDVEVNFPYQDEDEDGGSWVFWLGLALSRRRRNAITDAPMIDYCTIDPTTFALGKKMVKGKK